MRGRRELATGDRLGPYELEHRLGEGATGVVYRAVREPEGTTVALKILKHGLSGDDVYNRRFLREARVANEVEHHPHLVPVLDAGEHDGFTFLASAFRDGGSLSDLLADDGRLALTDCVRLALEIAGGLSALHECGIVHRDVKPANVMLDRHGASALTDYGLAKGTAYSVLTKPGQPLGTLDYLASSPPTPRSCSARARPSAPASPGPLRELSRAEDARPGLLHLEVQERHPLDLRPGQVLFP